MRRGPTLSPRPPDEPMEIRLLDRLADIDADSWNGLVGDATPFLEWEWISSLEESGCAAPESGWVPRHLTLWDGDDLIGACPLYLKSHSLGEFVFDQGWAEAAQRAGIPYYPKLVVGVPFTPATGRRFLYRDEGDRDRIAATLARALRELCRRNHLSSVHVNFCLSDELRALTAEGFVQRTGYQFMWVNPGWSTFDDYLAAFKSKRRVQIKRERRELADQGVEIRLHAGDDIPDDLFGPMFRLYKTTIDKLYWGRQYLNERLFELLRQRWKKRLRFFVARRNDRIVAGTFTVHKGDTLYGRYWGAFEDIRFLHFNVCYYASIEYCLAQGIPRFEPGAGGEFKYLRGFDAYPTESAHYLAEPRLAAAVADFVERERSAVQAEIGWLTERSAVIRRGEPA